MLDAKPLNKILFIDIETTSQTKTFAELEDTKQNLFIKRFKKETRNRIDSKERDFFLLEETAKKKKSAKAVLAAKGKIASEVHEEMYDEKAPIFPEFNKILVISIGVLFQIEGDTNYKIKIISFADEDEKKLLLDFISHPKLGGIINSMPGKWDKEVDKYWAMAAYNGIVFDFPVIAKRLIINGFKLPAMFDYSHLKPWELESLLIDPKKSWQMNVWDATASMDALASVFNVESSKDDIDGSEVKNVYWNNLEDKATGLKGLERIALYCEKDVLALARVYLKMKSMQETVEIVAKPKSETNE